MANNRTAIGRQVYDFFVGAGYSPNQAAAIAGNMAWEGGGRSDLVNPNDNLRNSPGSPHSAGIGQWNDRLPNLVSMARGAGVDIPDGDLRDQRYVQDVIRRIPLEMQLEFAHAELGTSEGAANRRIQQAEGLQEAAAGAIGYHRPAGWTSGNPMAGHGFGGRLSLAQQILASASSGTPGPAPAAPLPAPDPYGVEPPAPAQPPGALVASAPPGSAPPGPGGVDSGIEGLSNDQRLDIIRASLQPGGQQPPGENRAAADDPLGIFGSPGAQEPDPLAMQPQQFRRPNLQQIRQALNSRRMRA